MEKVFVDNQGKRFSYVTGLLPTNEKERFGRLLYRKTRGNAVPIWRDLVKKIKDFTGREMEKSLFVILFQESESLRGLIMKACEAFSAET